MKAKTIINKAKSYVGERSNRFTSAYGVPASTSWCCIFVWYVFKSCNASKLVYGGGKFSYVPAIEEWLKMNCKRVSPSKAKEGDLVIFTWGNNSRDHIGFYSKRLSNNTFETIEGNTLSPSQVAIRTRFNANIYAIYRPNYEAEKTEKKTVKKTYKQVYPKRNYPRLNRHLDGLYLGYGDKGANVKQLQRFLNWYLNYNLADDGILGRKTKKAIAVWQRSQGFKVTNKFGETSLNRAKIVKK